MLNLSAFPPALQRLVKELSKLPSVGQKSAQRLAYHLVQNDPKLIDGLVSALTDVKDKVTLCQECFFITEGLRCSFCSDTRRDSSTLCVVEKPIDVIAIERSGHFKGHYHVLHGLWAPMRGLGPESMRLKELISRAGHEKTKEVILAMSGTVEGDATALYLGRLLGDKGVITSRLAQGLPKGGELEYADDITLSHAFSGRRPV